MREFKADIVVGTGGYVCGPVVYAAARLGIPTIIHEQNSVAGLTNKFSAGTSIKSASALKKREDFPEEKLYLRETPCLGSDRPRWGKWEDFGRFEKDVPAVLIFGGSRGARPINEAVVKSLTEFAAKPYQVLYVTGEIHYDSVQKEVELIGNPENVIIKPFIHNMPAVLAGMDLVVSRAGATTLAEITALGIPSILIPSPYVTNNHQENNARTLSEKGAAILLEEKDLTSRKLVELIDEIMMDESKRKLMGRKAKSLGVPDSAARLYRIMQELVETKA